MRTKITLLCLAIFVGCIPTKAFKLESRPSDSIVPVRSIQQDDAGVSVSYHFPGAMAVKDDLYPESTMLDITGFGRNATPGEAAWPFRIDSFEIPEGCEAEVSLVSCEWTDLDVILSPARPLLVDSSDEVYNLSNVPPISNYQGSIPENVVEISDRQIYRDRQILYVLVAPVKCQSNGTKICENLTYRIDFKASKNGFLKTTDKMRHEVEDDFMRLLYTTNLSDLDNDMMKERGNPFLKDAPNYLILSIPSYRTAINDFVAWKKCMGYNIDVRYSNAWTSESIKSKIKEIYEKNFNLQYVLLIGDAKALPPVYHSKNYQSPYEHYSDYTYGCMDGENDMEQDILIGRLNVSNTSEVKVVINKIINYEKNPSLDTSFYGNAVHSAFFQDKDLNNYEDRRFTRTSEDIRNGLKEESFTIKRHHYTGSGITPTNWNKGIYAYGEPIPNELLKPSFKWEASASDVIKSINSGSFYVFHRGHGSYKGWADPSLTINSVSDLNNGSFLPVFFNIHCQSGAFGGTFVDNRLAIDLSFSEALLRKSNGGAVGVIAASEISYSGPNDALAMEMFQSIWPKSSILTNFPNYSPNDIDHSATPVYALGKILQKGMSGLATNYKGSLVPYTKRLFHCFGDPSMELYTSCPRNIIFAKIPGNSNAIRTNGIVNIALIMKDGSVLISSGMQFDWSPYIDDLDKISFYGHNIIPTVIQVAEISKFTEIKSAITNIDIKDGTIELNYDVSNESNASIRIRSVNNTISELRETPTSGGYETISTEGLTKGIYLVELIEDGISVDYRKINI